MNTSTRKINQNVSNGKYAVAMIGYRGYRREAAIGDGVTSATAALLTRCETMEEAEKIAAELNYSQPAVRPGSQDVPVYAAMKYAKGDYLSRQAREQNGSRDADRRIIHLG